MPGLRKSPDLMVFPWGALGGGGRGSSSFNTFSHELIFNLQELNLTVVRLADAMFDWRDPGPDGANLVQIKSALLSDPRQPHNA